MLFLFFRGASSFTRRTCQTVLAVHLLSIVRVIAPILPHLAEDVWQNLPFEYNIDNTDVAKFVFESKWPALNERWLAFPEEEIDLWGKILEVIMIFFFISYSRLNYFVILQVPLLSMNLIVENRSE